ncbi:DNA-directed RNA polymerase III subunit rpc9-like [Macadamia integrifolia]|uniref:DNA-directed RNA polymerase III subunit rpc9-like n=1 Tax=Macadamia integrifolia TaxID=60698 RepID=UPI001C4EB035|nr:DNA-directed RNA polymerase III subunit rpc9-like [Macadamia integrifolia]XP_042512910.1 DNA-directed RNA polymerase III subunit rpc9-like [Macadamia integrifolia]XP_042512911.1 DNA-directed RNA polymerase III subunit rpc9-like [Macadamia integrifolia]XP_042512912.1 DNA-directed RNA polymerase III subunit rpc9-like [Macadamia integrifolia]
MKILQANAGVLTNFEVLDFLQKRGASQDPTRVLCPVTASEFKVYDYLVQSAACNQTRECIYEFLKGCEEYDLAKAEKLNIINIRPSSVVEIDPIIEECEKRMEGETVEKLVEMTVQVLPQPSN